MKFISQLKEKIEPFENYFLMLFIVFLCEFRKYQKYI